MSERIIGPGTDVPLAGAPSDLSDAVPQPQRSAGMSEQIIRPGAGVPQAGGVPA
ncbi:hypothetical protein [Micromonospora sp. WP24]|uniref:hypothetical protein n=1 Tax=Micromonospora sp. WP24 TaxID=2604469 RepID=UPI0016528FAD|nr:hypothetical protein [Micromonospora sp. WP24]